MRPVSSHRDVLQYPLDAILGSEAQVRLIRVLLHEVDSSLSVADAARLAGLTPAGARKALERLEQAGFTERIGSGRAQKYGIRPNAPASGSLSRVFEEEQRRYDDFMGGLKTAVSLSEVSAAWVEPLPHAATEPVRVAVVADSDAVTWLQGELRARLVGLEKQFNLIIEIAVMTRADPVEPSSGATFLWGSLSSADRGTRRHVQTHDEAIQRSLRMARGIAELIGSDPSLVKRAAQHLDRLLHEGQGSADGDLAEWRQLLGSYSPERLRDMLVSTSSRAERLRQSSPFFAVLTAEERDRLLADLEAKR
jgi:hypothetical protein